MWLASPETNTYRGVYTWRDRKAMEEYQKSELFRSVVSYPHLEGITSKDFGILEGPTRATRGHLSQVA